MKCEGKEKMCSLVIKGNIIFSNIKFWLSMILRVNN